jgi:hypothetical protein
MVRWIKDEKYVDSIDVMPEGVFGFVYLIEASNGKKYVGQKTLISKRKRKFGKRESAKVTDKRLKLYEVVRKESNWKEYTGSNKELNEDIENGMYCTKYILHYAFSKKQLGYIETRELFVRDVLNKDSNYYNSNILGKYYRKDLEK